jgi:hypothetical protein
MTEAEWLQATDPNSMLEFVRGKASDRKPRLFAHALWLDSWQELLDAWRSKVVEVAFEVADDEERHRELDSLVAVARQAARSSKDQNIACAIADLILRKPWDAAIVFFQLLVKEDCSAARAFVADIFGNPFRPVTISRALLAWNDAVVVRLAQIAYEDRHLPKDTLNNTRLLILADALEEAGCMDMDILSHLRGPGPHVRGCWVVDLCLGKS